MTITSVGYAGTVGDAQWASMVPRVGSTFYSVDDSASFKVTVGVGTRAVSVAAGGASAMGIHDVSNAPITKTHTSVPSGTRWDLVVLRRTWATKVSSVEIIPGGSSKALPARTVTPGTVVDQPLALVRLDSGATTVMEIVDLRCVSGDGGVVAFDDLARSYLDRVGTTVLIGDISWRLVIGATGSPSWKATDVTDSGWVSLPLGAGWTNYSGRPARIRRVGKHVSIQGQIVRGTDAAYENMAAISSTFRPSITGDLSYVGVAVGTSSSIFPLALAVTSGGILTVPVGGRGPVNPETVILTSSWLTD